MRIIATVDGLVRRGVGEIGWLLTGPRDLAGWFEHHGADTVTALAQAPAKQVDLGSLPRASAVGARTQIWGIGLNYRSKVIVTGRTPPDEPTIFLRSSLTDAVPGGITPLPMGAERVDFEGELAVVVGRRLGPEDLEVGWDAVAFVTTANDTTARDVMKRTGNPALAKSFPGFGPVGPELATPDEFGDPDDVELNTYVNTERRQHDRTSGMLYPIPVILAHLARYTRLEPGDVVLTGSPAGVGDDDGRYLTPGDVVAIHLGDLEPLVSTFVGSDLVVGVADSAPSPAEVAGS